MTTIQDSHTLIRFNLWSTIFELQAISRQAHRTPKMTLNTKRSTAALIHIATTFESQISIQLTLWSAIFELQDIFGHVQVHQMTPKTTLNTKSSQVPHIHITTTHDSQMSIYFALPPAISSYRPFETSSLNDPKMTSNTKRSKGPHIYVTNTPSGFRVKGHLTQVDQKTPKTTLNA